MPQQVHLDAERRYTLTILDAGGPLTIAGMSPPGVEYSELTGTDGNPIHLNLAEVSFTYTRAKGVAKKTIAWPVIGTRIPETWLAALKQHRYALFVDTNTVGGNSVTCAVAARSDSIRFDSNGCHFDETCLSPWEFRAHAGVKPEPVGWQRILKAFMEQTGEESVCLVVDSELNRLPQIFARREPVVGDWYLPDGCGIMYAASDRDAHQLPNKIMREIDKLSRTILGHIGAAKRPNGQQHVVHPSHPFYSRECVWPPQQARV